MNDNHWASVAEVEERARFAWRAIPLIIVVALVIWLGQHPATLDELVQVFT